MGGVFMGAIALAVGGMLGLLAWAAQRGRPAEDAERGRLVFRHSLAFRILALVLLLGPLAGISVLLAFKPPTKEGDTVAVVFLYALFTGLGVPLCNEALRWCLAMDDDGLTCWSPWRGKGYIAWKELREVAWTGSGSYFILKSRGFWFRASPLVPGLSRLLEECEKRLPPQAMEPAYAGYTAIARQIPSGWMRRSPAPGIDLRKWIEERRRRADERLTDDPPED